MWPNPWGDDNLKLGNKDREIQSTRYVVHTVLRNRFGVFVTAATILYVQCNRCITTDKPQNSCKLPGMKNSNRKKGGRKSGKKGGGLGKKGRAS